MGARKPPSSPEEPESAGEPLSFPGRVRRALFGSPKSLADSSLFHRLTLVPFLAWIGLGADGLSSSAYGPNEAFRTLGEHTYLLLVLALMTTGTVLVISAAYKRIIEEFPHGGGGYVVATKLLGEKVGVVSGCALLVDYVLTISVSIAAAGDAIFSFLPLAWHGVKPAAEVAFVLGLIVLNIRGVRESVMVLLPVYMVFLLTHAAAILDGVFAHAGQVPAVAAEVGGGTYTGIEAVSNGLPIMREPRAKTGRRTMSYMAAQACSRTGRSSRRCGGHPTWARPTTCGSSWPSCGARSRPTPRAPACWSPSRVWATGCGTSRFWLRNCPRP